MVYVTKNITIKLAIAITITRRDAEVFYLQQANERSEEARVGSDIDGPEIHHPILADGHAPVSNVRAGSAGQGCLAYAF